ncbi:Transmembrane protein 222 [Tritrichomonas foetus]|uniref:Transmembrane protein 222 n=1 Tax=Tritrichomonas foetus TaxID=1144522 RepID=A0A1J4K4T3_9EUKA|nr:Transmembrane protein 222 [Tritrichomonas foetus]|eukprot:OHT04694.1 Transmembrane protein 222 [Tritrichomonas foetus]
MLLQNSFLEKFVFTTHVIIPPKRSISFEKVKFKMSDIYQNQDEEELNFNGYDPRLSCCVVWTQIPILTWIFPALGHVGICDSHGCVYDFQGHFHVGKGEMLFADPRQRWKLSIDPETLDRAIHEVTEEFQHIHYSLLCSNCHFYVATVLDRCKIKTPCLCCSKWCKGATAKVAWALVLKGRSLSVGSFLATWIPFLIFYGIIILIVVLLTQL